MAPTLIAVRVGLGSSIHSQFSSSVRPSGLVFAAQPRSEITHVLDMPPMGDVSNLSDSILDHVENENVDSSRAPGDLEMGSNQVEEK